MKRLIERMRTLEADHDPDSWPAVQMRDVSALCGEALRLQSILEIELKYQLLALAADTNVVAEILFPVIGTAEATAYANELRGAAKTMKQWAGEKVDGK